MEPFTYIVDLEKAKTRLDVFLASRCQNISRSYIQKLIEDGFVTVNEKPARANHKLRAGEIISMQIPPAEELKVEPENIPLDIYYEDSHVIVLNKPRGMVVHPAEGNITGTLVNALLYHCHDLSGINGIMRPGIVHRLDKDTSGLIMVAKHDSAHQSLAQQLKDRTVTRRYQALVHHNIKGDSGTVNAPIGRDLRDRQKMAVIERNSKVAVTHFKVLERFGDYTLIECRLETGRTHQIRVHMTYIGFPLVGDLKYGPSKSHFHLDGQLLHAKVLGFKHPVSGEYLEFSSPLPDVFESVLTKLRHSKN